MKFEDIAMDGTCNVCGKHDKVAVLSSAYGAVSFAYCNDCWRNGLEPYGAMVSYISGAGCFPDDINEKYKRDVRRILKARGIDEQTFIDDVKKANEEYAEYCNENCQGFDEESEIDEKNTIVIDMSKDR